MKGMKGRILRKLKCIPHVGHLKPGRVLHVHASDGFLEDPNPPNPTAGREGIADQSHFKPYAPAQTAAIDVLELIRDLEGDEEDKENIRPTTTTKEPAWGKENIQAQLSEDRGGKQEELKLSLFRRPDLNSGTLFDPDLLAAFQQAVMATSSFSSYEASSTSNKTQEDKNTILDKNEEKEEEEPPSKIPRVEEEEDPSSSLSDFEQRCPPGGKESVILYTTTLGGVRKTFEECNRVRFLLSSLRVVFYERDVSMHLGFREELWSVFGGGRVIPPRLFIRGRYIGGADEVLGLHERGSLRRLVLGLPEDRRVACDGCGGIRFLMCFDCGGSCKLYREEEGGRDLFVRCPRCNENGLVICPLCC